MTNDPPRRATTTAGRLARLGFGEPERAEKMLSTPPLSGLGELEPLEDFAEAADPDLALQSLARVLEAADVEERARLVSAFGTRPGHRAGLIQVLGVSQAAADHLVRHPADWSLPRPRERVPAATVRADLLSAVGADPTAAQPVASGHGLPNLTALRCAYKRQLLRIMHADVVSKLPFDDVAEDLSDLADAALDSALAIARAEVGSESDGCRLAVIALGKSGGRELNYVSDVDVIFVVAGEGGNDEATVRDGTKLATALIRACGASTPEGSLWEVDAGLRPEGRAGALVRTLESHVGYYERWAQTWEFQALLKARAAAGDRQLGQSYVDAVAEFVWSAAGRTNFVEDVQAMRRRVEKSVSGKAVDRQLKLGPGGLRDVEFSVQLLQLVHGRGDVMLRGTNTMRVLESLADFGYVGRTDAAEMAAAYRFLRTLEHRIQMFRLRRTHVVPETDHDLRRIARSMGFRSHPRVDLEREWRARARDARRLHEKLFYRPLLQAVARLEPGEARLTVAAAGQRLEALGFQDATSALRHIEALTSGVSRRASIQRTLLPVLLSWFADSPDPDAALLGFRQVSEALGATPWYLRLLRDESPAARRLADVLGSCRYAVELLQRAPDGVAMLGSGDTLAPRDRDALRTEMLAGVDRQPDPEAAIRAVRAIRRRELFRISVADVLHLVEIEEVGRGLSDVTLASLSAAVRAASASTPGTESAGLPIRFLVVAMGRVGGAEAAYSSDADVMFVYDAAPGTSEDAAARQALAIAGEVTRLLSLTSTDPPLEIDADLRPEGRNGPLVRSLASYAAYYDRWAQPWEAQALLRATPVCGDPSLWEEFRRVIDPLRYPAGGPGRAQTVDIRRLKARMESERLPRGADPTLHVKLGRGGLSDVEWTAQLLQMEHGHRVPALRTTGTLPALRAAAREDLIQARDADLLSTAWMMAARMRNAVMLATGHAGDSIPLQPKTLARVSHVMGYPNGESQRMVEDYRRAARRARNVVERVFYAE